MGLDVNYYYIDINHNTVSTLFLYLWSHTHTHTHTHSYIYISCKIQQFKYDNIIFKLNEFACNIYNCIYIRHISLLIVVTDQTMITFSLVIGGVTRKPFKATIVS